jgi:hypothetical protein
MPRSRGSQRTRRSEGWRHRWVGRASILLVAVVVAIAVTACGSSGKSGSGSGARVSFATAQEDAVRFTACMRSHGVSNFPDPTTAPHELKISLNPAVAQSPAFRPAMTACRHLLPGGGPHQAAARSQAQIAELVAFARCLRSHGFPSFPDPTSTGQLTHEMLAQAGINLNQPAVVRDADACVGVTHGLITKTDVARFVAGQ